MLALDKISFIDHTLKGDEDFPQILDSDTLRLELGPHKTKTDRKLILWHCALPSLGKTSCSNSSVQITRWNVKQTVRGVMCTRTVARSARWSIATILRGQAGHP